MVTEKSAPIKNDYIRLAGRIHDRSTGVPRLYLGPNHLLILKLKNRREVARRFYYEDITALRCVPTWWGYLIDGAVWAIAALFLLNYLTHPDPGPGAEAVVITTTFIAGIAQMASWLRGPTCRTWLHTANHTELLTSLGRYDAARRAIALLHDRIVEAQAERYGEDIDVARIFKPDVPIESPAEDVLIRRHDARLMKSAFSIALFSVFLGCLDFFYGNDGTIALGLWIAIASATLCTAAIVRSYGTDCPPNARRACFLLLATTTLSIPITLAAMAFLALNGVDPMTADSIRDVHPSDGLQFVVMVGLHAGMVLFDATCAITGLVALSRNPTSWISSAPPR